ncbi:MAG: hypothetical protein TECD_00517 [Hyphomicrobiaceae bacterium hypho_1]
MIGLITYLDIALLAITSISGLLAMYRGFTREILSIVSWIMAACAVFYFIFYQKNATSYFVQTTGISPQLAQIVLGGVIFLIVLYSVHLITSRISDAILDGPLGVIDRLLGLIFGIARGFLLVVIPYMFWYGILSPQSIEKDFWIKNSLSRPYIESTGSALSSYIQNVLPNDLNSLNNN